MKERNFDFTITLRKGPVHTKQEIIDSLKQFARENGVASFTQKKYDAWKHRALCSAQIADRFGSWTLAMESAGIKPMCGPTKDPIEMVETFMDCWVQQKDVPTVNALVNHLKRTGSKYTIHMYTHYFGGVRRLARRVSEHQLGKISENQLVERYYSEGNVKRQAMSPKQRLAVLARDGFRYVLCGQSREDSKVTLEVDHRVPVTQGGSNDIDNLQTLCKDCNRGKRDNLVPLGPKSSSGVERQQTEK